MSNTNLLKGATHSITAGNEVIVTLVGMFAMFIIVVLLNAVINVTTNALCPIDTQRQRLYNNRRGMRREDKYSKPKRARTPPRKTIGRKKSKSFHQREFMIGK
tara:strand:+ start:216 stop:524 length:309 start_codon:yes stop_codon:yes gene_type:complete